MSSKREAENVIRKIRKSRHANDKKGAAADANARSLSRALDMLSTQLYTKATHFILEMIQNADDNTYPPGVDPGLTFAYREDGYLWVGCNEVGFSKANVEAICDINDSTKKVKDATKGYIGEKGIGFKSVFKVADVVWVSSGHYTFRFERDEVLGMIVPIWCDFNSTTLVSERTMFCLRIPDKRDRDTVKKDLLGLQTELLLFLRKLRRIDVRIYSAGTSKPSFWFAHMHQQPSNRPPETTALLTCNDLVGATTQKSEELFLAKAVVDNMPAEAKREGIRATQIVMAFPMSPPSQKLPPRRVYNFLPICTFGFTFLLQADFILTANRENISRDNAWNDALLDGALNLFISAIRQMNLTGLCKYSWPSFTAANDAVDGTVMEGFISKLRSLIQEETVLESQAGYLSRPSELMLVPKRFTDGHDPPRPLFDEKLNTFKYVSFDYSPEDLAAIGLTYQTPEQVCDLLKWMTPQQLEEKPALWHSRLAAGITEADPSAFSTAKIIPLRDGEWVSAAAGPVYISSMDDKMDIPDGIEVKIIKKEACADPARKRLFTFLGAKPLTESQICDLIMDRHRFLSLSNNDLSVACLVSHAWYLFSHGSLSLEYGVFKLANELGQAVAGDELYMQLPSSSFRMKDYLPGSLFDADFVHPDYLYHGNPAQSVNWHKWLTDTMHVSLLPNIMSSRKGRISREFQHLIDHHPSRVWLTLIRDNWQFYSMDPALGSNRVGSIPVQCTNKSSCQIRDAYLAVPETMRVPLADQYAGILDVPDPLHPDWLNLTKLGVRTTPDLDLYLTILRAVAKKPPSEADADTVVSLYQAIQKHIREDVETAKSAFANERLILPSSNASASSWRTLSECRWSGPSCLQRIELLSTSFPSCEELFVTTLNVRGADASDVLEEICHRYSGSSDQTDQSRATAKALLLTLSTFPITGGDLHDQFQRLSQLEVLPLRKSTASKLSTFTDPEWFIPDRTRYARTFEDQVWMLDFDKKHLASLRPILERMGIRDRGFSQHVREQTTTGGECVAHRLLTEELRAKARFIALLSPFPPTRAHVLSTMQTIEVFSSHTLTLRRYIRVPSGTEIYGDDEQGRTVLEVSGSAARLYFSTDSIESGCLPWHFVCDNLLGALELPEERHSLLNSILHTRDKGLIEDVLERAGLVEERE